MMLAMHPFAPAAHMLDAMALDVLRSPVAAAFSTDAPRLRDLEDGSYALTISAPGVSANDLKVSIEDGVLEVDGESKTTSHTHVTHWTMRLPKDVDVDKASVTSADGIITVALLKKAP